jgi:hypothetical protein
MREELYDKSNIYNRPEERRALSMAANLDRIFSKIHDENGG